MPLFTGWFSGEELSLTSLFSASTFSPSAVGLFYLKSMEYSVLLYILLVDSSSSADLTIRLSVESVPKLFWYSGKMFRESLWSLSDGIIETFYFAFLRGAFVLFLCKAALDRLFGASCLSCFIALVVRNLRLLGD